MIKSEYWGKCLRYNENDTTERAKVLLSRAKYQILQSVVVNEGGGRTL